MSSGQDESRERDQSQAKKQPPPKPDEGADAAQPEPGLFENLDDFMPDEPAGEPRGSIEPTTPFVPVEPTESLQPLEPFSQPTDVPGFDDTGDQPAGEPEATEAFDGVPGELTHPESNGEGEDVAGGVSAEPGLTETIAFKSTDSEVVEAIAPSEDELPAGQPRPEGEIADAAPAEGEPHGEGEPAPEGIGPLPEGGLLGTGLLGAETTTGEPGAEAEAKAEEEEAEEEEAEKGPGILAWIGDTSVYNILLFVAAVALILGSLGLYLELKRYNFDIKAREGKQPIAAAAADYADPMTTAAA